MSSELVQISMTGELGSGKSTTARYLVDKLGVEFLSTGAFQREMAAKLGITTLELNHRADVDPAIDEEIDSRTRALENSGRSFVIDSRLAWRFLPSSFKVFLVCPPAIAAQRAMKQERVSENFASHDDAMEQMLTRQNSERLRFLKTYDASQGHYRNYDLAIDTSWASQQEVGEAIIDGFKRNGSGHQMLAAPQNLFMLPASAEDMAHSEVKICCARRIWAVVRGHDRVAEAIRGGLHLLSVKLMAQDDETYAAGKTARSAIEKNLTLGDIQMWEKEQGFKYKAYPSFLT